MVWKKGVRSHVSIDQITHPSITKPLLDPLTWHSAKSIYWLKFTTKEITVFIARYQARRTVILCSRVLNSPMAFRKRFLMTVWGKGIRVFNQLLLNFQIGWWWGNSGKDWRWEKKGKTLDEMVGWHYRLDRHEFE